MRQLLKLTVALWCPLIMSSAFSLFTIAANVGLMTSAAYLISLAALHPPLAALSTTIVSVRFWGLSRALARYAERYTGHDAALRLLREIRVSFFRSLEPLPASMFARYASADLFSRMVADVETLKYFPVRIICPLIAALVLLIGMTTLLASLQLSLALWFASGLLTLGCIIPWFLHCQQKNNSQSLTAARLQLYTAIADSIRGIRDLTAFGRAEAMKKNIESANTRLLGLLHSTLQKNAFADACGQFIANLVFIGTLAILVGLVRIGKIDGVLLAAWALLIQSSFEAFLPLTQLFRFWEDSRDAATRLFSLVPPQTASPEPIGQTLTAPLHLRVEDLCFSYAANHSPVLAQINFELHSGKRLAVVGASGSGKSTLVAILAGLQPCNNGTIFLNEVNCKLLSPAAMQNSLGVVLQHDYLFHATIADNLRLARPNASDQELWAVLDQVFLADMVRSLPNAMETRLGNEGHGLSGGERRRLSLARLLLKNPDIILLDEPTAGLDPELANRLLANDSFLLQPNRAVLLVTHQLAGLQHMDEILVLDHGRIIERGRMGELLANQGYFYQLWALQQDHFDYPS